MEHQAATSAFRSFSGKTLAEQAEDLTVERRALRKQEILDNSDLLHEAIVEFGDVEVFEAVSVEAFVARDLSLMDEVLDRAAENMAAHEVKELTEDDLLRELDDERMERRGL